MKVTHPYVLGVVVLAIAVGAWFVRKHHAVTPNRDQSEYDAFVERLGGDEPAIRSELSDLIRTTSAPVDSSDRAKINTFNNDDLLQINHVRVFIGNRDGVSPYHFVSGEHRLRLSALAGESPSPARVLAIRKSLAEIAAGLAVVRQPPDWNVTIEGEPPPPMPILDVLRDAHLLSTDEFPILRTDPRVPAFATADGELLGVLDQFFNCHRVREIFPPSTYPKLYCDGRVPPIPTAFAEYHQQIAASVQAEQRILLGSQPHPDSADAVNDVYRRLEQFLSAIVSFEK